MKFSEEQVSQVVRSVMARLNQQGTAPTEEREAPLGVFASVQEAVDAAAVAQRSLVQKSLECRRQIIATVRKRAAEAVPDMARMAHQETGMGRIEDKIAKNLLAIHKTPGLELLNSTSWTGDNGLTLTEWAPYGVIASITPSTNPTETLLNNGIGMIAAGNAVVFNPHPMARNVSIQCIDRMNRACVEAGGPEHLFCCVEQPSIETAQALMRHSAVGLVVVTGGGGVVRAAMTCGKKCIAAGPGNPPVVVDATAHIAQAGVGIVRGASFDNNIICTDEKEVFVVDAVADELIEVMRDQGAVHLSSRDTARLEKMLFPNGALDRSWVGKDAGEFLRALELAVDGDPRLVIASVDEKHPFVQTELLMPVLGIVRVPDVETGIEQAIAAEQGCRHTASMYSRDLDALHTMARAFDGSIFVKNAPNYAGLGFGGEGFTSWTIASPTGEGLTSCRNFTRQRRCTLAGYFRIV